MKNFSWNYFSQSGKVESYLLYKDLDKIAGSMEEAHQEQNVEQNDVL